MRIQKRYLLLVIGAILATAGCSKLKNDNSPAAVGGVTTSNSSSAAVPPSSNPAATPTTWQANATSLHGKEGETMTLACAPDGGEHPVISILPILRFARLPFTAG